MQSVSSSTTRPPEPIIAPTPASASKSTGVSASSAGTHPPDGPPTWTALNVWPSRTPAADVLDNLADGHPHRHLDQAAAPDLAGQREHLGAFALRGPQSRRIRRLRGAGSTAPGHTSPRCSASVGRPHAVRFRPGYGGLKTRHPAPALHRRQQRRLLAAHERAGSLLRRTASGEKSTAAFDRIVAQQPPLARTLLRSPRGSAPPPRGYSRPDVEIRLLVAPTAWRTLRWPHAFNDSIRETTPTASGP